MQQSDELEPLKLEPPSLVSPRRRQKTAPSNQKPPTSKIWEIFSNQKSTNYLSSATNMMEYKNGCQYFHSRLTLIARGFSINELKNIFNATLPQFLEDGKEYDRKTTYRTLEDKYDWVTDKLIKWIRGYARLWLASSEDSNYRVKYLHTK